MNEGTIDLPGYIIALIVEVAKKFPEIEKIIVFGSRVLGNAKPGSDLDMAVVGKAVTTRVESSFRDYLEEETNIPYLLDIIRFETIGNTALREHILHHGMPLYIRNSV